MTSTNPSPARHIIAVGSGKGGVGKSTVSLNVALALADSGAKVGLLDADLYGPNIPLMIGLMRRDWGENWTLARNPALDRSERVRPIERFGLRVMSAGFLIGEDQPLIWEGEMVRILARQLLQEVEWDHPDFLIVDLPPGTADVQQALIQVMPFTGAVVVVTPQDVAHLDARKAVHMYERLGVPLFGGIENMSGMHCPHCGERIDVFARVPQSRAIWAMGVDKLGEVPLNPVISQGGDRGRPVLVEFPDSPQAAAFRHVAARLREKVA